MEENKNLQNEEMEEGAMLYTLQDENGTEYQFELIAAYEKGGVNYYAMVAVEDEGEKEYMEYVILKGVMEDGEESLVSIDDDDEFEDISAYFDNLFSEEIDYDAN